MKLQDYVQKAGATAREKGWWDNEPTFGEFTALVHSELSEALEEHRNGKGLTEVYFNGQKPEGIPIELADVLIRIFDYCDNKNIDIEEAVMMKMAYNSTRSYRHGGKAL